MAGWKSQIRLYGGVPVKTTTQAMDSGAKPRHEQTLSYYKKEQADICLRCTKKHCRGGEDCFKSRKKEQECAESGPSSAT